jgi:hypothetical protein
LPFAALHWRRGDFRHFHAASSSSPQEAARALAQLAARREPPLTRFFLATDAPAEEVAQLWAALVELVPGAADAAQARAAGACVHEDEDADEDEGEDEGGGTEGSGGGSGACASSGFGSHFVYGGGGGGGGGSGKSRSRGHRLAVVQQLIASRAAVFMGTQHSTFSHAIHHERQRAGVPEADGVTLAAEGAVLDGVV